MPQSVSYYKSQAPQQFLIRTDILVVLNMLDMLELAKKLNGHL